MCCAGLQIRDNKIEVRPAQYYTQHAAGIYQGAKPTKLKGLAHAKQSVHRVSASLKGCVTLTVVLLMMSHPICSCCKWMGVLLWCDLCLALWLSEMHMA